MRPQGCHLPVLSATTDNDAYVKMAIANVKVSAILFYPCLSSFLKVVIVISRLWRL